MSWFLIWLQSNTASAHAWDQLQLISHFPISQNKKGKQYKFSVISVNLSVISYQNFWKVIQYSRSLDGAQSTPCLLKEKLPVWGKTNQRHLLRNSANITQWALAFLWGFQPVPDKISPIFTAFVPFLLQASKFSLLRPFFMEHLLLKVWMLQRHKLS